MTNKAVTLDVLEQEVRFLLKTLLRDDLFGEEITLTEAERLLDSSLSLPFAEYSTFLKRNSFIGLERTRNLVLVLERGEKLARGDDDDDVRPSLGRFFKARLGSAKPSVPSPVASSGPPDVPPGEGIDAPPSTQFIDLDRHDRYVREGSRGEGTVGHVFFGTDTIIERPVVIKVMDHIFEYVTYINRDELKSRLRTQWLAQARFRHPHILPVLDMDFSTEEPEVILSPATGSLRDKLEAADDKGLKNIDAVCGWMAQAMWALAYAHEAGTVHGGIKPENLLVDRFGNIQVSDFGMALVADKGTETGIPVYVGTGNASYMPPEQLQGKGAHPGSDIYALGMVFYELLTGQLPGRRSPMPSEHNKAIPAAVDDVFDKMTMDRVDARYATMQEALDALVAAAPNLTPHGSLSFRTDPLPHAPPASGGANADADKANGAKAEHTDPNKAIAPPATDASKAEPTSAMPAPVDDGSDEPAHAS